MREAEPLAVVLVRSPGAVTVRLAGEVDLLTAPLVNAAVIDACGLVVAEERLVVDLSAVTFFGGAGLTALVLAKRCCDARGVALVVVVTSGVIWRTLRCTGVNHLVTVVDGTGRGDALSG